MINLTSISGWRIPDIEWKEFRGLRGLVEYDDDGALGVVDSVWNMCSHATI